MQGVNNCHVIRSCDYMYHVIISCKGSRSQEAKKPLLPISLAWKKQGLAAGRAAGKEGGEREF